MSTKLCKKCGQTLNTNLFWKNQAYCILCQKKEWKERENKDKYLKRQRDKEHSDIAYSLLRGAKKRAKALGREFSLKRSDLPPLPEFCPILGVPLAKYRGKLTKNSYSLDRVDNSKGYVPGNVQVISMWANVLKEQLTLEQARKLVKYMEQQDVDNNVDDVSFLPVGGKKEVEPA